MTDIDKLAEQIAENANCSLDKLAREIGADEWEKRRRANGDDVNEQWLREVRDFYQRGHYDKDADVVGIRLGLEAGMKLQRERDAVIADDHSKRWGKQWQSGGGYNKKDGQDQHWRLAGFSDGAAVVAKAIRSAL